MLSRKKSDIVPRTTALNSDLNKHKCLFSPLPTPTFLFPHPSMWESYPASLSVDRIEQVTHWIAASSLEGFLKHNRMKDSQALGKQDQALTWSFGRGANCWSIKCSRSGTQQAQVMGGRLGTAHIIVKDLYDHFPYLPTSSRIHIH